MKQYLLILMVLITIGSIGEIVAKTNDLKNKKVAKEPTKKYGDFDNISLKSITNSFVASEDTIIFSEDFEGDAISFTTIDANIDTSTWSLYSESSSGIDVAYEGDKSAGSYSGYQINDDYLVSSAIALPIGKHITFSFYARSRDASYPEDFNLKLSTTGKAVSDFSTTIDEVRNKSVDWELMEYDLSSFAGDTVYIAFQSISNDKWELYIDKVEVRAGELGDVVYANFNSDKPYGQAPEIIQFTDISSGNVSSWLWNFGDGSSSTDQNPSHNYSSPGYYTVSLEVSNGESLNSKTITNFVTIIDDYSKYGWNNLYVPDNNGSYMELYFFDENNGFVFQYDQSKNLLRTTNGGNSWTQVDMPDESFMYEIDFADSQNGYIRAGGNFIYKSIDGGANWTKIELPNTFYYHRSIDMEVISSNTVILTLDNSAKDVIKTVDGGSTWTILNFEGETPKFLSFVNDTLGYLTSQNYNEVIQLFKTTDGGVTWTHISDIGDADISIKGINYYSENVGFIYGDGFKGNDMVTFIWKTTDGGLTTSAYKQTNYEIRDLECLTPDFVFFSGTAHLGSADPQIHALNYDNLIDVKSWKLEEVYTLFFVNPTKAYAGGSKDTYVFKKNITSSKLLIHDMSIKVYPNPAKDRLQIQCNDMEAKLNIELLNSYGQVLYHSLSISNGTHEINLSGYSLGTYFLRLYSEKNSDTRKIIIQ